MYWPGVDAVSMDKKYPAYAYNEKLHEGKINGVITVSAFGLTFKSDKDSITFPIQRLALKLGGASDRLVLIGHPANPDWHIATRDRSLLCDPSLADDPFVHQQMKRAKGRRIINWSMAIGVSLILIIIPLILLLNISSLSSGISAKIPAEWEAQLGESAISDFQDSNAMMDTTRSDPLLAPLVDPLLLSITSDRYDFHFYIMNNESLNAFALPGGFVVLHTGLIQKADSAEEVLGVLAHEISHVTEQHSLRSIINTAGIYLIFSAVLGDLGGIMGMITDASYLLINQGYSRAYESEADEQGHALLFASRIDPRGLGRFFEKLMKLENDMLALIENEDTRTLLETSLGYLSTHPATTDRIDNLKTLWENDSSDYLDLNGPFRRLKAEVDKFVLETNKESTGDESRD